MPERRFETAYWSDPFVMRLPAEAKLLYAYLWTNLHCNQAGLYEIAPETISFETGLMLEEVPKLMSILEPKVAWYPEQNLVWVKNFLRSQTKSPQFLIAAARCLESISNSDNGLVREFLDYNRKCNLSIPYRHPKDRVSVSDSDTHTLTHSDTDTHAVTEEELGVVKGEEGTLESKTPSGKSKNLRTFGELRNVKLTPEEHDKLVAKFGAQGATSWIDELSLAKASKGYKSKSDYATILAWDRREVKRKGGVSGDGRNKQHTESHGEPYVWEEAPDEPDDTS